MKFLILKVIGLVMFALTALMFLPKLISAADWILFGGGVILSVGSLFAFWFAAENILAHAKKLSSTITTK